jgi:hypothetical protein
MISEFTHVETGGRHDGLVEVPLLSEFNDMWSIFSMSILAKSSSILFSHSNNLTGSPAVDIVNLDPSADVPVQVMHCKKFVMGDLSSCTQLHNIQV